MVMVYVNIFSAYVCFCNADWCYFWFCEVQLFNKGELHLNDNTSIYQAVLKSGMVYLHCEKQNAVVIFSLSTI